jgi:hypothetical protein
VIVNVPMSRNQANNTTHPMEPYAGDQFSQSQKGVPSNSAVWSKFLNLCGEGDFFKAVGTGN